MKKLFLLIISLGFLVSSCERDDICAESTPTTPLLVIDFFDADNPSEPKIPADLLIVEEGSDEEDGLGFTTASISIPLRTNLDQTRYSFILNNNSDDIDNPENTDIVAFNYVRQEEYISKACGFRVTYQALQDQFLPLPDNAWIDNITILNTTIEDETETHIRIFH